MSCTLLAIWLAVAADPAAGAVEPGAPKPIVRKIPDAMVQATADVEVAAQEAGLLSEVCVREGQTLARGDPVAQIADREVRIERQRKQLELEAARRQVENDVDIRFARKSAEVAEAELRRAKESRQIYAKSVSDTEADRLELVVQRARLEVEQAEYDAEIAELTRRIKQGELEAVEAQIERRRVVAPLAGVVANVYRQPGEWVEPGDAVVRIVRVDRLRVEGFLPLAEFDEWIAGAAVRLRVGGPEDPAPKLEGKIVFVSPEVDPVNSQIRVWAEVENRQMRLRPGMRVALEICPPPDAPLAEPPVAEAAETK
jgi:RND family efflux transporter MFP subunit